MKSYVLVTVLVCVPLISFAGGAEEADLECYQRTDLAEVSYDSVAMEVDRLLKSGGEALVCMSRLEESKRVRTVAEVRLLPKETQPEKFNEGDILSMGSSVRVHQEVVGPLGTERLSPFFAIQILMLPTANYDFSKVETISAYVGLAIMEIRPEDMTYNIGRVRELRPE